MNSKDHRKPRQEKKESRSFLANTATSLVKLGLTVGTVAGAVAGTRMLLKNSSTTNKWLNNTSKFLSKKVSEVGAYNKAFNQTVTESGWTRFMTGQAQGTFKSNLVQEYKSVALQEATGMGSNATLFEKAMMATKEALDNARNLSIDNVRIDMMKTAASAMNNVPEDKNFMLQFLKDRTRAKQLSLDTMTNFNPNNPGLVRDAVTDSFKKQDIAIDGFENQIEDFTKSLESTLFKSRKEFVKDNVDAIDAAMEGHKKGIYKELYNKLEKTDSLTSLGLRKLGASKFTIGEFMDTEQLAARSSFLPKESFKHHGEDFIDFSKKIFADMDEVLKDQKVKNINNFGIDTSIFKDLNGQMLDMRFVGNTKDDVLASLAENIKVPFIGIRPFQTLSLFNKKSPVDNALFSIFKSGTQMSTIESQALGDDYYLFGNKLFNSAGETTREGVTAIPNRGASARAYSAMTGASRHTQDDERNFILKGLSLGRQEENSVIDKGRAYFGKNKDINNPYTLMTDLKNFEIKETDEAVEGIYKLVSKFMEGQTKAADYDSFSAYANKALSKLGTSHPGANVSKATEQLELALKGFDKDNLASILETMDEKGSKNFDYKKILSRYYNDPLEYDIKQHTRDIQIELMQNVSNAIGPNGRPASIINELYNTKGIGLLGSNQLMDLDALYKLRASANFSNGSPKFNSESYENLRNLFTQKDKTSFETMERMASEVDNIFTKGHLPQKENAFKGNSHILIGEGKSLISGINEGIKGGKGFFDTMSDVSDNGVFNQLWAGRKDMSKVTEATIVPYFYLYRLNEGMGWGGMALGVEDLGSVGSIAKNMFLKRFLAPAAIITGASYLDFEAGNLLGEEPSDLAAKAYYGTRLNVQAIKEVTGINAWSRNLQRMMPGINRTLGNPFGMALDTVTFGAIGEDRGYADYRFNLEKGSDPVRKGRFWSFGSDTPFYGGRVEGYEVPLYRKIIGEPENTDVLYGTEENRWAHSWLPNLRNPLGTLRNLIDPYWLENMHKEDRPYPAMGGIPELEAIPLVGGLLSGTIGNIIKPPRVRGDLKQAYSEYIKDINEKIKSSAPQEGGGYINIAPGGRITDVNLGENTFAEGGENNGDLGEDKGILIPKDEAIDSSSSAPYVDIYGGSGSGRAVRSNLSSINRNIINRSAVQRKGMYTLDDLRDPNVDDALDIAQDPNSMAARLSDTYYSMTEVGGIYGFLANSVLGEMQPEMRLANSSKMGSWSRAWWDKRMGGLGSEISEIGRRFLPNNRNSITDFNPYKNQMPDWMPGCFIAGTQVYTKDHSVNIEDLIIGDNVLSHDGTYNQVEYVNKRLYNGKIINLDITGLTNNIITTQDHPFFVIKSKKCPYHKRDRYCKPGINPNKDKPCKYCKNVQYKEAEWIEAQYIEENDYVLQPIPKYDNCLDSIDIQKSVKRRTRKELKNYNLKLDFSFGAFIGFWLAEGYCDEYRITCGSGDNEPDQRKHFDIIGQKLGIKTSHFNDYEDNGNGCIVSNMYSIEFSRFLKDNFGTNSYNKVIPEWVYNAPKEFLSGILAAYIEGDGSLIKSSSLVASSVSKDLILGISNICNILGITYNTYISKEIFTAITIPNENTLVLKEITNNYGRKISKMIISNHKSSLSVYKNYILRRVRKINESIQNIEVYNLQVNSTHTYNVYGIAVHNSEYMTDMKHGDPYTKVIQGESRLPGAGYEATHKLHSDPFFGRYGALDRMNILGDVAPWSEQYKYYSKAVSALHANRYLSDEDYEEAQYTRDTVRERKKPFELYEYKFKYADQILKRSVTIENVIDDITFTTSEMPGTPIRLAGIKLSKKDTEAGIAEREYLQKILKPGARITIGTNEDPLNQIQNDTLGTIRAAVYNGWGDPIQKRLVALGAEGKYNKSDAATVNSLFSSSEIMLGKMWEGVSHLDTPFNTKFMQVRSPLEHYKRTFLYGKEFKSWTDPVKDWIIPTVENAATWNPLGATVFGGIIGSMFGTNKNAKIAGAAIGAVTTGLPSSIRVIGELLGRATGDSQATYIPKRRQKEREIEEYFDKLKYLKYMGLYQKARRLARQQEGVDVEKIVQFSKDKGRVPKKIKQKLKSIKKWIKLGMQESSGIDKEEGKEKLDIISQALKDAEGESLVARIGPQAQLALKYRQEAEATLFGADPNGDLLTIFRAMPKKERQMMKYFMTAPPEEREEILRLVPKNQRRFYQSKWGLPVDKEPTIQSYFSNHFLPGPNWSGWKSNESLQGIKLKVIKREGLDARDMGFFAEDERAAANSPEISMHDIAPLRAINPQSLNDILRGAGLQNSDVRLTTSYTENPNDTFGIDFDLLHDRRKDVKKAVNENIHNLI